jgi:hypothetical protein
MGLKTTKLSENETNLLLGVKVESHLRKPLEGFVGSDLLPDQTTSYRSPVNVFVNLEKC